MARSGTHHRQGNEQVVIVLGKGSSNIGSLAKTIQEELLSVGVEVDEATQAVFDEVGKDAAQKLKETSPVNPKGKQSGRYAKGWTYKKGLKRAGSRYKAGGVVYNKTDPQLTHLLEYGHPIVRKGRVVGESFPVEHIGPVADWAAQEIESKLSKQLGGK